MTTDRDVHEERWPLLQSLPFRVVAFLSLALLPIGLLAIWQTKNLDDTLRARTELSLIALTESAVSGERQTLQRAVGAAQGQAVTYRLTADDPAACSAAFKAFQMSEQSIGFAGFLPVDGNITCSSSEVPLSVGSTERTRALATSREVTLLSHLQDRPAAEDAVVVLMQPVLRDDTPIGQIVLTLPTRMLSNARDIDTNATPLSLAIFNRDGEIILGQGEADTTGMIAPDMFTPGDNGVAEGTFLRRGADGARRTYVVRTLVPGVAYAVAGWAPTERLLASNALTLPSFLLPALMWFASLLVAYFAVHRLVVSPVQDLGARMRRFASDRSLQRPKGAEMLPQELFDLEQTFVNMAYDLIDDEAQMENALREKNILLKEVHHRVKNNLQMISSIMNMQIRTVASDESRQALRRLQDRVLGLATAHRLLYQSQDLARADAGPLLHDICAPIFAQLSERYPDATHSLEVDAFSLVPDQAVPLALLAGEVGTNAIAQMPDRPVTPPFIDISLRIVSPGMAQFRCRYSAAEGEATADEGRSVALQLMRAFALQLGGVQERLHHADVRVVSVDFPITTAIPDALDY